MISKQNFRIIATLRPEVLTVISVNSLSSDHWRQTTESGPETNSLREDLVNLPNIVLMAGALLGVIHSARIAIPGIFRNLKRLRSCSLVSKPALVLRAENLTRSTKRGTVQLCQERLHDLFPEAKELQGINAHISGQKPCDPNRLYQPYLSGDRWISDPFVQVNCYRSLDRMYRTLKRLGYEVEAIQGSIHRGHSHPARVLVNISPAKNALFSSPLDAHLFGKNVALDGDVVVHEAAHGLWHHIHPFSTRQCFSGEFAAIHEGASDAFAAILHRNPSYAEDLAIYYKSGGNSKRGLRDLKNRLTLEHRDTTPHGQGEIYGAFFWSLYEKFQMESGLKPDTTGTLCLRLIVNHWFHYKTFRPTSFDFVDAVVDGAKGLERVGLLPISFHRLEQMIIREGTKRKMITPGKDGGLRSFPVGSVALLRRKYASTGPIYFRRVGGAPYLGGKTEIYQQQVPLKEILSSDGTPLRVDVVGHGFTAWNRSEGIQVSLHDVCPIQEGEILERVNVSPLEALQRFKDLQRKMREEWKEERYEWGKMMRGMNDILSRGERMLRGYSGDFEIRLVVLSERTGKRLYYEVSSFTMATRYFPAYEIKRKGPLYLRRIFRSDGTLDPKFWI